MAPSLTWILTVFLLLAACGSVAVGCYLFTVYPWHRVNQESRVPVQRRTVDVARYGVSGAFVLLALLAVAGLLSYRATMLELQRQAMSTRPEYTIVERVVVAFPWDVVAAGSFVCVVVLLLVPFALVLRDVAWALLGRRDASDAA